MFAWNDKLLWRIKVVKMPYLHLKLLIPKFEIINLWSHKTGQYFIGFPLALLWIMPRLWVLTDALQMSYFLGIWRSFWLKTLTSYLGLQKFDGWPKWDKRCGISFPDNVCPFCCINHWVRSHSALRIDKFV